MSCDVQILNSSDANLVISSPTNSFINKQIYCRYGKDTIGQQVLDCVCDHLNILHEDRRFFGLEVPVSAGSTRHSKWVRTEKLVRKQLVSTKQVSNKSELQVPGNSYQDPSKNQLPFFKFTLKVFPTKTSHPEHEISRQYCCYVIRRLIREQKLFPSKDRSVQLAACTMQSLCGDYLDSPVFKQKTTDFHKLEIPEELIPATEQMYRRMAGTNPALAEELFLGYAHNIDLYGVHLFDVKDSWGRDTDIGVSLEGIIIYGSKLPKDPSALDSMAQNEGWSNGGRLISWGHIQRLKYTDKNFTIDHYTTSNEDTATVNFKLNHFRFSKDLYFTCIKHHDIFKQYREVQPAGSTGRNLGQNLGKNTKQNYKQNGVTKIERNGNTTAIKSESVSESCSDDESNSPNFSPIKNQSNLNNRQTSRKQRIGAITSTQDGKPIDCIPGATLQAAHVRSLRKKVANPVKFKRTQIHEKTHENLYLIKLYPGPVFDERSNVYGFNFLKNPGTKYPARVSTICLGGSADRSELRKGDQIIQVNSVDVQDFEHNEIQSHIKSVEQDLESRGLLSLVIISNEEVTTHKNSTGTQMSLSSQESTVLSLLESIEQLRKNVSSNETSNQFFSVPVKRADMMITESDKPKNLGKNRYKDIKPYDETRVILRPWEHDSTKNESDYINANIIEIKLEPDSNEVSDSLVFNRINSESGGLDNWNGRFNDGFNDSQVSNQTDSDHAIVENIRKGNIPNLSRKYTMNDGLSYDDMGDLVSRKYLKYIAAQGPKHDTCSDFWKMMLQNGVQFIVMLTQLQDRGREKCYRYWPEKIGESVDFSVDTSYDRRIQVTLSEEIVTTSSINPNIVIYIERRLKVRLIRDVVTKTQFKKGIYKNSKVEHVEQHATITQLHYYAWPDHGVPDDVEDFLKFTEYVSKLRDDWDKEHKICTTICVHCSAGIGRTGVLILAETGMNQIRQGEPVSPYNTLKTVRSFRPNMVQTARQFSFACASILKWNQYDHDVTVWSPQGRLFQLEYAMEAVKQGSATIGLKSNKFAVLVALKRAQNDLCDHQTKILPISQHCGLAMSGLTADGRSLCNFMRQECLNEDFVYSRNMELGRLLAIVGDKMQSPTQSYGRRPYGVGLLVAGFDESGPHIYETCPSANYFDCKAMAIGARSQSARTYIEKNLDHFGKTSELGMDDLVKRGLEALRETLPSEQELSEKNVSIGIVGEDHPFQVYDNADVKKWLEMMDGLKKKGRSTAAAPAATTEASSSSQAANEPANEEMQE